MVVAGIWRRLKGAPWYMKGTAGATCVVALAYGKIRYDLYYNRPRWEAEKSEVKDKTFIVTGASSGIGLEIVHQLALKEARIVMACRDYEKCVDARRSVVMASNNKRIFCRVCDLSSYDSIRSFAALMLKKEKNIHGLINNAAVARLPHGVSEATGVEKQLAINHMGHFLLTNLLLEGMVRQTAPARIVTVACPAHKNGKINWDDLNSSNSYDPEEAYTQSKLAQVMFSQELARRLQGTKVTANLAGLPTIVTKTQLNRHAKSMRHWYNRWWTYCMTRLMNFPMSPDSAACRVLFVVANKHLEGESGKFYMNYNDTELLTDDDRPLIPKVEEQVRLWRTSEKWTNLEEQRKRLADQLLMTVDVLDERAKTQLSSTQSKRTKLARTAAVDNNSASEQIAATTCGTANELVDGQNARQKGVPEKQDDSSSSQHRSWWPFGGTTPTMVEQSQTA